MSEKKEHLSTKKCIPCTGDVPRLSEEEAQKLLLQLGNEWFIENNHHLEKEYLFPDFKQALHFTNRIAAIAEEEQHHPDIHLAWGKVRLSIWTHKIKGLTESDFILAAKCDEEMTQEIVKKSLF